MRFVFASVLAVAVCALNSNAVSAQVPDRIDIDIERIEAAGIRRIAGKHLDLFTDLPVADDVDELTEIFDQAVPQWCDYFRVDPAKVADWKLNAFLMLDKVKFAKAGLLHRSLPPFLHGYQTGHQFWLFEQPSPFFRRHLMLHEGTHAFMNLIIGGAGPPWYSEGMAELLGCHQWQEGKLTIGHRIASREESPYWGRVKVLKDAVETDDVPSLKDVLLLQNSAFLRTNAYGWAWAATAFFDGHPVYHDRFRKLQTNVKDRSSQFTIDFIKQLDPDWEQVQEQWQLFVNEIEYGYDVERTAVVYKVAQPIPGDGAKLEIVADRGWQSAGFSVVAGQSIKIEATGRYSVAQEPEPWICEPDGITIHYFRGKPLGILEMAIQSNRAEGGQTSLIESTVIGSARNIKCEKSGTLFFRINDSPASLEDNNGKLTIRISPE